MAKQESGVLTPEEEKEDNLSDILSYDPEKEEEVKEEGEKEDDLSDVLSCEEEDLSDVLSV